MPIYDEVTPRWDDKRIITERELKDEIVHAIVCELPPTLLSRMISKIKKSDNPWSLKDEYVPVIENYMDEIIDHINSVLLGWTVEGSKKYDLFYHDPYTQDEIFFNVDLGIDLKDVRYTDKDEDEEEYERMKREEKIAWERVMRKTKEFLKKCLHTDDLAGEFFEILVRYILDPRPIKITPSYEKGPTKKEMEQLKERIEEWRKGKRSEEEYSRSKPLDKIVDKSKDEYDEEEDMEGVDDRELDLPDYDLEEPSYTDLFDIDLEEPFPDDEDYDEDEDEEDDEDED
jgi:hypothetical protein